MLNKNQTLQQGRFSIIHKIGDDNATASYEAFDKDQNSNVLIKEIHSGKLVKENTPTGFSNKADLIINLNHQSLLRVHNYFAEENRHYLVMEKLQGHTLGELVRMKNKPFSLSDITNWAFQILDATSYLHNQEKQILHRDIKPDNTLLDLDGNIKLFLDSIVQHSHLKKDTVSEDEQFDSTNLSFSPLEQVWEYLDLASRHVIINSFDEESQKILEKPVDVRGDLYSIGTTLYYLATAKMPFDALSRLIDMMDGNDDPLKTPNELNPAIPKQVSDVIMGALEIKRENRYSSATIMKQILSAALSKANKEAAQSSNVQETITELNKRETEQPIHSDIIEEVEAIELDVQATLDYPNEDLEVLAELDIAELITNEPDVLKIGIPDSIETPKVEFELEEKVSSPSLSSETKAGKENDRQKTKPWVFSHPKTEGQIDIEELPKAALENEHKQQLESIKEQLKEAQEKRIAAEQLVAKAAKLLNAQETEPTNEARELLTNPAEQFAKTENESVKRSHYQTKNTDNSNVHELEESPTLDLETASSISEYSEQKERLDFYSVRVDEEQSKKAKDEFYKEVVDSVVEETNEGNSIKEILPKEPVANQSPNDSLTAPIEFLKPQVEDSIDASGEFNDNFALPADTYEDDKETQANALLDQSEEEVSDELFEELKQKQNGVMKIALAVFVLLFIGITVWQIWNHKNSPIAEPSQAETTTNVNPKVETKTEKEIVPATVETDDPIVDEDSVIELGIDDSDSGTQTGLNETKTEEPTVEIKKDSYISPKARSIRKPVYKPKVKNKRVTNPKRTKSRKTKSTQAPKPEKPKKKAVTLDDLLKGN